MSVFSALKVVGALPGTLAPDTIYAVRTGVGFSLFISDTTGSIAHPVNVPALAGVPLGRWSGTSVAALTADNVFNDSLYSSYVITGQFRPATNGANLTAVLRSSAPADVGGGMIGGQTFSAMTTASQGGTNSGALNGSVSSTGGVVIGRMLLMMPGTTGQNVHPFIWDSAGYQSNNLWYAYTLRGLFLDGTPRQGIKFSFSSGNIAAGWFEVIGIRKQ